MSNEASSPVKNGCEPRHGIQVIARSAQILRVLGDHPHGMSLSEISELTDLPRSTVHRIVSALAEEMLVEVSANEKGYRIGPAIGRLLHHSQTDIISEVRPFLEQLSTTFGESTYLAKMAGQTTQVIDRVIAEHPLRIVFPVGADTPLLMTDSGKALLALMPDRELLDTLTPELFRANECTRSRQEVIDEIHQIRKKDVASQYGGYIDGICGYSVGLKTYLGNFATGVVLPTPRLGERESEICDALLNVKREIEQRIGSVNAQEIYNK